jgi:hypothetical protein
LHIQCICNAYLRNGISKKALETSIALSYLAQQDPS